MKLIGICGLIGSGKDTVADHIELEYGYIRLSMATALKDAVAVLFDWPRELLEGKTKESREFRERKDEFWSKRLDRDWSPRYALQYVGTEMFREILHDAFWVYTVERKIIRHDAVVISDIRFPNEIEMIRNLGGQIWQVRRGENPEWWPLACRTNFPEEKFPGLPPVEMFCTNPMRPVYPMEKAFPNVHYSEWAWAGTKFDHIIDNNDTLDVLYENVNKLLVTP